MTSESWHTDDLYDEIDREAEACFRQRRGWTLRRVLLLILVLFLIVPC
jgi:hypothetical protein